jgi:hypothetical protein
VKKENVIISKEDVILNRLNVCCSALINNLSDLTDTVESDFASTFTMLSDIRKQETVIKKEITACCNTLSDQLAGCCSTLNDQLENLKEDFDDCCAELNSKIDSCLKVNCDSTPIVKQTTITASGTYCLANDVVGASPAIVIASNDVVLDLNGHKISNCGSGNHGIQVKAGQRNIVIKNGSIERSDVVGCPTAGNGIDLPVAFVGISSIISSNIRLENLFIRNWNIGINADKVADFTIDSVQVIKSSSNNVLLHGCNAVTVRNSLIQESVADNGLLVADNSAGVAIFKTVFKSNENNGLLIDRSAGVQVDGCEFDQNGGDGAFVNHSSCVEFFNCVSNGGSGSEEGFHVSSSADVVFKNCVACANDDGFLAEDATAVCIIDSVAKANNVGFNLTGNTTAILRNNTATNNHGSAGYGFFDDSGNNNQYYNNAACKNDLNRNFSAAIVNNAQSPVTSPMNARGMMNVDCDNTQVDQVVLILDEINEFESEFEECCAELNSKADQIIVDLNNCCATVNSKLDVLSFDASRIDINIAQCCTSINSRLDIVIVDLDDCCSTLNSKVDVINVNLNACCFTVNSKLDNVDADISKVDFDLNSCCFTVNSKLDNIDLNAVNCCSTVNSKLDVLLAGQCTHISTQTTITASGTYCLINDIVGSSPAIVINHNDVVLDLSGFKVTNCGSGNHGIQIVPGTRNILIKNGTVEGCSDVTGNGIDIPVTIVDENPIISSHIRLERLFIRNWDNGINAVQVTNLEIDDVQVANSSSNNIEINGCNSVTIINCIVKDGDDNGILVSNSSDTPSDTVKIINTLFNNNVTNGIFIEASSNIHVDGCELNENRANGLRVITSSCIDISNCAANGGSCTSQEGFDIETSSNVVIQNCLACGNCRDGFFGNNVEALCILNSEAKANNNGFNLTNGTTAILRNNTATNNTGSSGWGFFDDSGSVNQYYNNAACGNHSGSSVRNFSPDIVEDMQSPVTSPMNARGFMNVDCSNSQIDQVAEILSKVSVLDSKLDECCFGLSSNTDSLSQCCATVNSKADVIIEDLNQLDIDVNSCCATVNSKLDVINGALNNCCVTLNSKIDNLDLDVAECCFTINSKLDELSGDSSKIDADIEACCATVNSKLDALSVDTSRIDADVLSCCATVNSKLDAIDVDINECCVTLNSKIDVLVGAQCTHITGQTTITTPGVYCLVVNVVGASPAIVINSNNVVVDLSGMVVSNCGTGNHGIQIIPGHTNIEIRNGSIIGCTVNTGNGIDIPISALPVVSSSDIRLKDLYIANWNVGINAVNVSNLKVSNVQVVNSDLENIELSGCSAVTVENSVVKDSVNESGILITDSSDSINIYRTLFNTNRSNGLFINASSNVHVEGCEFNGNTENGVRISNGSCIEILNSVANGGSDCASEEGFDIEDSFNIVLKNCVACGNCRDGFFANNVEALCIFDSVAKANNNGFNLTNGTTAILRNNTATNNVGSSGWGFFDDSGSMNQYYTNSACNNHSGSSIRNFSPDIINDMEAPVTSPMNARGQMNVDCSNSQIDQVAQILSKVCVLDSKIDVVIVNESRIDADLLDCCFTLGSKIDSLDVDLADCCATINSKLDDLSGDVSKIDFDVTECCYTLNSKVDVLAADDFTIESKIDSLTIDLAECCSKTDDCCATLNSKIDYLILRLIG